MSIYFILACSFFHLVSSYSTFYICTNENAVDYYSYNQNIQSFPHTWSLIQRNGYCTSECYPCEKYSFDNRDVMIGYSADCTISYENQLLYQLYNVTNENQNQNRYQNDNDSDIDPIKLDKNVNPFEYSGIFTSTFHSHSFITKYNLCIYEYTIPLNLPINSHTNLQPNTISLNLPANSPTIPLNLPTNSPTIPLNLPTNSPTIALNLPTNSPTIPLNLPANLPPTTIPLNLPINSPTTLSPTIPLNLPTNLPTNLSPTNSPTNLLPTNSPTNLSPTNSPPTIPLNLPTNLPPTIPLNLPINSPTTLSPTKLPTNLPTIALNSPTTLSPTIALNLPINLPINSPTNLPTNLPTNSPTNLPTTLSPIPMNLPTNLPTNSPTNLPTNLSPTIALNSPINSPMILSLTSPTNNNFIQSILQNPNPLQNSLQNPSYIINPTSSASTTSTIIVTKSYDTTTIVIISTIILLLLIVIYILYKQKQKATTTLPHDIKKYKEKHKGEIVIRLDEENKNKNENNNENEENNEENNNENENFIKINIENPQRLEFKKQIKMKKSIKDEELFHHTAISYSSFFHVYETVKKNWDLSFTSTGLKKYTSNKPLSIFALYQNTDQLCNPLKTYNLKKVIQSNDNQNIIVVSIEEKIDYLKFFFKERYLLIMDISNLYCITAKTNIPEYNVFYNYSYRIYEDLSSHPLYQKINNARNCVTEYDNLSIKDVEEGTVPLSTVNIIQNQYKEASVFLKEIENLKINMKNTNYKLRYFD